jgi:hypothetical protein
MRESTSAKRLYKHFLRDTNRVFPGSAAEKTAFFNRPPGDATPCKVTPVILHGVVFLETETSTTPMCLPEIECPLAAANVDSALDKTQKRSFLR